MVLENEPGMLGKMKRGIKRIATGFDFASAEKNAGTILDGMNLPPRLARCDSAYETLQVRICEKIFALSHPERVAFYADALNLTDEVIGNLNLISHERNRSSKRSEDPAMPLLLTLRELLLLLEKTAAVSDTMDRYEKGIEEFAGTPAVAKLREIDDSVSDLEVSLMHNVAALFERLESPMRKDGELRRRALTKSQLERYSKAKEEFFRYFAFAGKHQG